MAMKLAHWCTINMIIETEAESKEQMQKTISSLTSQDLTAPDVIQWRPLHPHSLMPIMEAVVNKREQLQSIEGRWIWNAHSFCEN